MKTTLSLLATAILLAACSSTPKPGSPEAVIKVEEKRQEQVTKAVVKAVSDIPDWYVDVPCDHERMVCGVATASSSDLQMAVDKAIIDAKYSVADKLRGLMSGKLKRFVEEVGGAKDPQLHQETTKVISNLFVDVNTSGYRVSKKKVIAEGGSYRAFAMIEFPVGEANRVLVDETRKNQAVEARVRSSKAFADLDAEIKAQRGK